MDHQEAAQFAALRQPRRRRGTCNAFDDYPCRLPSLPVNSSQDRTSAPSLRRPCAWPGLRKPRLVLTICNHWAYFLGPSLAEINSSKGGLTMGRFQLLTATLILGIASATVEAGPPVRIGIGIGLGFPYYRPYYPYYYGYPYGYPYVVPGPVVYQAPPVVVQSGPVVGTTPTPSYSSPTFSAPEPNQLHPVNPNIQVSFDFHLARLSNPDEALRRESVMELGRSKNER